MVTEGKTEDWSTDAGGQIHSGSMWKPSYNAFCFINETRKMLVKNECEEISEVWYEGKSKYEVVIYKCSHVRSFGFFSV